MNKPISPPRQRMLDDMTFRNMSPNSMKVDNAAVARSRTLAGAEDR